MSGDDPAEVRSTAAQRSSELRASCEESHPAPEQLSASARVVSTTTTTRAARGAIRAAAYLALAKGHTPPAFLQTSLKILERDTGGWEGREQDTLAEVWQVEKVFMKQAYCPTRTQHSNIDRCIHQAC